MALEQILEGVKTALEKVVVTEDVPIYKAIIEDKLNNNYLNIFNINPESEITNAIKTDKNKINFYKINLKEKNNALFFSNIIFYDNQNKTLIVHYLILQFDLLYIFVLQVHPLSLHQL